MCILSYAYEKQITVSINFSNQGNGNIDVTRVLSIATHLFLIVKDGNDSNNWSVDKPFTIGC